jgi:hypothetical protein
LTGTTPPIESKRVKALRLDIAKQIPKFPTGKASKRSLEGKSLGPLLIDYTNWAIRYVVPRPREVIVEPTASTDSRWKTLQKDIDAFLAKVKRGDDLTPHLSRKPHTQGYTPAASAQGPNVDRWADKDMLLNVMGYHHFHPSVTMPPTNEIIFAYVTREECTVVGIFDHAVFKSEPGQLLTPERERLWQIYNERLTRHVPPGSVVVASPIMQSGHSMYFLQLAKKYARLIADIDQRLEDPAYISSLTAGTAFALPAKPKWKWHFQCLDLGLIEEASGFSRLFIKGPN